MAEFSGQSITQAGFDAQLGQALANLQSAIDGKAPTVHGHAIDGVQGLEPRLDGFQAAIEALENAPATGGTGGPVDLSPYYTSEQIDDLLADKLEAPALDGLATTGALTAAIEGVNSALAAVSIPEIAPVSANAAVAQNQHILADSTNGAFTLTVGAEVTFFSFRDVGKSAATNTITLVFDGGFRGQAGDDLIVNTDGFRADFIRINGVWEIDR